MTRLEAEKAEFDALLQPLSINPNWRWDVRATAVGMRDQYNFFYRYSSRLLHAEPVSFATHQPVLEEYEIIALLDYIFASLLEAVDVGREVLKLYPRSAP